ncbi:unnamed protein product [Penicillium nalgiovense]|uniref:5'-3' DNA helicase ZGRF1-like N-terminal domain-containing protein n=1 Tax=Penicillium nalgiovense TaxID=60175 RepID=A0A9W4MT78_PENNA|nr:unnamed protein product [Penicillium nalgiovense]CAG7964069.1 unnamed protein product [Penicillium nalgiovense]CAG8043549.1 unnamed protein product [Penicillium nalgiovense]CAG8063394.1 unnamed protein product [Penicillium nalgiovense]CAG8072093.1 unnamed protein product [Penicillium nalgiovense]
MMSTPSSSARLPPTSPQVTASVAKFRCLYTHDLRRKSKRWHDGYLRYHKFNKRVMVYDDQGNFIGDHHWRSPDDVQDGDEMELDKGVLIEVTENMGTTETDITTLYEKKKSSQGSPQSREPASQVPRTSASVSASVSAPLRSSQSFRSLNDLLGIKRTSIGHLVSPYEQRNPPQPVPSIQEPERAQKRQRTYMVNRSRAQGEVIDLTDSTGSPQGLSTSQMSNQVTKEPPREGGDSAADVLVTNCAQRSTLQSTQLRPQRPSPPSFSRVSDSATCEPIFSLPTPEVVRTAKNSQPARPLANKPKNGHPHIQPPKPIPSSTSSLPAVTPETEISRPRGNLRVEHSSINRGNQSRAVSRPMPPQRSDPPTRTTGGSTPQAPVRTVTNYVKHIEPADNQASINGPPSANVSPSTNMPPPSRPSSAVGSGAPTAALRMGTAKPRRKLMYSALLPGALRTPSPATSDTPPGSATRETVTNTPEQQLAAAPDNSANEEFVPSISTQFIFDEMINGSGFKSPPMIKRLTGKRSLDSPLRKSISDPTALTAQQVPAGGSFHAANKENEPKEQGPWTSEALDLFDFWPAGRPKPNEREEYNGRSESRA